MFDLGRFLELSTEIRRNLKPDTVMVATVGDKSADGARRIREAGYAGTFHAVRHLSHAGIGRHRVRNSQASALPI